MGLDMYLTAKRTIVAWTERDKELNQQMLKLMPELAGVESVDEIKVNLGYWRKANAVHQWFVDNVQDGEDDCGAYCVGPEQLDQLKDLCLQVLAFPELASQKLPTTDGFLFGSIDYDDGYFQDLENTAKIIDRAAQLSESNLWGFEYQSSW